MMPQPNVALLKHTLAHIEANPERWDQTVWVNECGTAFCFAGWAVQLYGGEFAIEPGGSEPVGDLVVPPGADPGNESHWQDISIYAAEILGIPRGADCHCHPPLFDCCNTLDDLRRLVSEYCEGVEIQPCECSEGADE